MHLRPLSIVLLAAAASAADLTCPRFAAAPTIDGDLAEWTGRPTLAMSEPTVDDLKVEQACLGWDDANLYLGMRVLDHTLLNLGKGNGIANGDCADLRLTLPGGRLVRLLLSPVSADNGPACMHLGTRDDANASTTDLAAANDPKADAKGVHWAVKSDAAGWTVEAAVPWTLIKAKPAEGTAMPFVLVAWDRDQPDDWKEWHRRSESASQKKPEAWPKLVLAR